LNEKSAPVTPIRFRWEKETRYYEVHIHQDLWGGWVLTRIWGRRNSPMGQMRRVPCESYDDAARKPATVRNQRTQRSYEPVGSRERPENEKAPV
jgi:predicted DNA-binding WGR domain protein